LRRGLKRSSEKGCESGEERRDELCEIDGFVNVKMMRAGNMEKAAVGC
jgi:hypothetical protein